MSNGTKVSKSVLFTLNVFSSVLTIPMKCLTKPNYSPPWSSTLLTFAYVWPSSIISVPRTKPDSLFWFLLRKQHFKEKTSCFCDLRNAFQNVKKTFEFLVGPISNLSFTFHFSRAHETSLVKVVVSSQGLAFRNARKGSLSLNFRCTFSISHISTFLFRFVLSFRCMRVESKSRNGPTERLMHEFRRKKGVKLLWNRLRFCP